MNPSIDNSQKKLSIVLGESEIERIPHSIQNHPQIKSFTKKRNEQASHLLLDASFHHAAMKKLPDAARRGRPDIAHRCALLTLDSWANCNGFIDLYIHTRNNEIIWINPKTRLPRQYHRFTGLLEKLFRDGKIASNEDVLLTIEKKSLDQLLQQLNGDTILYWENGEKSTITDIMNSYVHTHLTIVLGAFPHGDFHQAQKLIEDTFSVEEKSFPTSYLLSKTIINYEQIQLHHK